MGMQPITLILIAIIVIVVLIVLSGIKVIQQSETKIVERQVNTTPHSLPASISSGR